LNIGKDDLLAQYIYSKT